MSYGNLMNRIMEQYQSPEIEVGMGVTILMYSDRHAGTVIEVNDNMIVVQRDRAVRTDDYGMSDTQNYDYFPDPTAEKYFFRFNVNKNRWEYVVQNIETGRYKKGGDGYTVSIGHRDKYYDYSF